MRQILFALEAECDPSRIRKPVVGLDQFLRQKFIAHRTREGYINNSARMNMADFRLPEAEFCAPKAMSGNRNPWPRGSLIYKFFHLSLHSQITPFRFR